MSGQHKFLRFWRILCLVVVAMPGTLSAQAVETITEPGEGTFTVPENVSKIIVEVWGGGGSGAGNNGGGGGGGAYSQEELLTEPGTSYNYSVGSGASAGNSNPGGDSVFGDPVVAQAKGGRSSTGSSGAVGGSASEGIGSVRFSGGAGASGYTTIFLTGRGGGGGGSARSSGNGQNGNEDRGGESIQQGGDGGDAGVTWDFARDAGEPGAEPGGGGGGGDLVSGGGGGGAGRLRITYQVPPQCSAVFDSEDGINEQLPSAEWLDLSVFEPRNPQPWPDNSVIPAGYHVYQSGTFGNQVSGFSVDGQARVLVDGGLTIDSTNFTINAYGAPSDLLLIVDGDLTISKPNVEINAVIYVTGDVRFANNSVIVGALGLEGEILDWGNNTSPVKHVPSAASDVDFGGACIPDGPIVVLDHIRIVHPGLGLTCQAAELQVLVCADATCSTLYPDPVDITLQPAGWLPSQNVTVTGVANLQFQRSSEETVNLGVSNASPAPDNGLVCVAPDGSGSCDMAFRNAGFVFEVPDLVAGEAKNFSMAALETDEQTGQCTELFAGETRTIDFGTTYLNPGPTDREATLSTYIDDNPVVANGSAQKGVPITFDDNGVAEVSIRYDDAGRNSLLARYVEENQPDGGILLIEGAAGYVSVPLGLCLIPEQQCISDDLSCENTLPAGVPFSVTPRAYRSSADVDSLSCADKLPTPSFAAGDVPVFHQLSFPSGGVEGDLLETTLDYGDGVQALTLTEVGVFSVSTPAVPGGYLGRDLPASDATLTARMVPDQLVLSVEDVGELNPGCGGFIYTGQIFGWEASAVPELRVEALNGQTPRQRTLNYTNPEVIVQLGPERFQVTVPAGDNSATWNDASSTPVPFRSEPDSDPDELSVGDRDSVTDGIVRYRFNSTDEFIYPKSAASRTDPFSPDLTFLLRPMTDADDVQVNGIPAGGKSINPIAAFPVRYGRLSPQNVYGPENIEELQMPLQMEYWTDSRFILNEDDTCTLWNTADITDNTANHHELLTADGTFAGGLGGPLVLEANGSAGTDTLTWGGVNDWQRDDLDGDGLLDDPTAIATFGVYRGHDRIIYWREVTD